LSDNDFNIIDLSTGLGGEWLDAFGCRKTRIVSGGGSFKREAV
jgi:hypothetical protein